MSGKKKIRIGTIRPGDIKVRRKLPPATRVQKSVRDYDRNRMKEELRKEVMDE